MRIITIGMDTTRVYTAKMCACIGYFDGVHLGHQALIQKTLELAKEKKCESALITFDPDPWVTIKGVENVQHITTMKERINRIVELGIQNIIILKFTREMSMLNPGQFVNHILSRLALQALVCGFDFHYGFKGEGNVETLRSMHNLEVHVVEPVEDESGKISSTRISKAIEDGDMESAGKMLGQFFSMEGIVVHGRHQGTSIGFPTANLNYSREYLLPKTGVYAGFVKIGRKRYQAMINLGHNPTFNYRNELSLEAHILNFKGDLYGKHITVCFVSFIRPEKRFQSRNNLILQLDQDVRTIQEILKDYE